MEDHLVVEFTGERIIEALVDLEEDSNWINDILDATDSDNKAIVIKTVKHVIGLVNDDLYL